jgi:hypothetical protein
MTRKNNNQEKETTMTNTDTAKAVAELMNVWNKIEACVKAAYPKASKEKVYRLTAAAMNKAVGV